jgi:hypothetical protein
LLLMVFRQSKILIFLLNTVSPHRYSTLDIQDSAGLFQVNAFLDISPIKKPDLCFVIFFIKSPSNRCPAYPRFNRSLQVLAFHDIPPIKDSDSAIPVFQYWLKFIFL